jgi:hypothetical protein
LRGRVSLPTQFAPTLFHAALARGADLNIADMTTHSAARLAEADLPGRTQFPAAAGHGGRPADGLFLRRS